MFRFLILLAAAPAGWAQCIGLAGAYAQNFDSLAAGGQENRALPAGWSLTESGTSARNNNAYAASSGEDVSGDVYSFGAADSAERAFGTLRSGTLVPSIGACFVNQTGGAITSLTIRYTGEMWRAGVNNRNAADRLDFQFSVDGSLWTDANNLDFASPATSTAAGPTDGNSAPFRAGMGQRIGGLNIAAGATFYIRWTDFDIAGSDDGLAVDDFEMIPATGEAPRTCAPTHTISEIQGAGSESPFAGQEVMTTGIVTMRKTGASGGYFLQWRGDGEAATSDGVFVFTGAAVPAEAVIGNELCVFGTVTEFRPASDPYQPPLTELASAEVVSILATAQPLPEPAEITAADTDPAGGLDVLEHLEAMRVTIPSLEVTGPTAANGVFFGVVEGVARPFREPGVQLPDPLPEGSPEGVPRFDGNPERIRVAGSAPAIAVNSGALVGPLTGVLDYAFRTYTLMPEPGTPTIRRMAEPVRAPQPEPGEVVIATVNLQRFFDDVDDPGLAEPVLSRAAFDNRLTRAVELIRDALRLPDIVGVQEVENLAALERLAERLGAGYRAFLVEGNDPGGIDSGLLVRGPRVTVQEVRQDGKDATYLNPQSGQPELLNDRPPLVLRASADGVEFTVIVNHLRSLLDASDVRVRAKRKAQAEYLARLIASLKGANVVSIGDYNAYSFNDGYVDVIGTIRGAPAPDDQVVAASPDLVDPDLTDLATLAAPAEAYSYVFDGSAQTLDHILVNEGMLARLTRFVQTHANADFPESARLTDHDQPVAYFRFR